VILSSVVAAITVIVTIIIVVVVIAIVVIVVIRICGCCSRCSSGCVIIHPPPLPGIAGTSKLFARIVISTVVIILFNAVIVGSRSSRSKRIGGWGESECV